MSSITPEELRNRILNDLWLLADPRQQWDYALRVPIADVPSELFEAAGGILELHAFQPEILNEQEGEAVERLGWSLANCDIDFPIGLIELQQDPRWIALMDSAREGLAVMEPDLELTPPENLATSPPAGSWAEYFASMEDKPLHPLYKVLDKYLPEKGDAFELACGVGQGARHLAAKGLKVWATDVSGDALTFLYNHATPFEREHLSLYLSQFKDLDLAPEIFDVVVAAFCLFFMPAEVFAEKWPMLAASVRSGGLFMGQFLGPNDDWASKGYTWHSRDQILALLEGFELLHFEEVDQDGKTSQGTEKHWHIFHVIAKKP